MLSEAEMQKLKSACLKLPKSSVQEEESHVISSPILILMSTVLSLNRGWYSHAVPARRYFEQEIYPSITPKTLGGFQKFIANASSNRSDWLALARTLWKRNEWDKARMLSELIDYFVKWCETNAPALQDLQALQHWAPSTTKDQFLGNIKGLAARAHEQLLWYLEGKEAIKFDRHVSNFVNQAIGREVPEKEAVPALRQIAADLGISATALDARIWDHMQARSSKGKPGSITSRGAGSCRNRFHKRVRH